MNNSLYIVFGHVFGITDKDRHVYTSITLLKFSIAAILERHSRGI